MDDHSREITDIKSFSKKETYTAEEKKMIMDRLNEERLIHQRAEEELQGKKRSFTEEEKKKILDKLNEKRLSTQKREEIKKKRLHNKKRYKIANKEFYKFTNMEREYYIEIADCDKINTRASIITLYYKSISEYEVKKKDVLIKTEIYSDKFFVSYDWVRVYFKAYALEDEK
ncbi:hypothetical protein TSL6_08860 [Sulfurovum sp. TSL6]|uniref:hypothetical protein n=1 Tax=Sulfurovum sp. TSL6 TaxID=2826995 RepID=UPI001CC5835C|nr:hypothetical protein [Sulfurovum sp. TSL6]GIU00380.1 hypothetical protein TSL6_08860 [Sulfurovum sp. TSL6]